MEKPPAPRALHWKGQPIPKWHSSSHWLLEKMVGIFKPLQWWLKLRTEFVGASTTTTSPNVEIFIESLELFARFTGDKQHPHIASSHSTNSGKTIAISLKAASFAGLVPRSAPTNDSLWRLRRFTKPNTNPTPAPCIYETHDALFGGQVFNTDMSVRHFQLPASFGVRTSSSEGAFRNWRKYDRDNFIRIGSFL